MQRPLVGLNPDVVRFCLGHDVEHARGARFCNQRTSAASVVYRALAISAGRRLAGVMHKLDGAVDLVRNLSEDGGYLLDGAVVVLRYAMRSDERIEDQAIYALL